jgi:hypothetical protein
MICSLIHYFDYYHYHNHYYSQSRITIITIIIAIGDIEGCSDDQVVYDGCDDELAHLMSVCRLMTTMMMMAAMNPTRLSHLMMAMTIQ